MQVDEVLKIKVAKFYTGAFNLQSRRHPDWRETYRLYRDKVIINRLTQRQSVNVPLMKETIKTMLSQIDDAPDIKFEDRGNNEQAEMYVNEYWNYFYNKSKYEIKDIVDKKQVGLYGRSWKKINIRMGAMSVEILDPLDVLVDRFVDPSDIETANYICHQHIYRTLSEVLANPMYNQDAKDTLKLHYSTEAGLVQSNENSQAMQAKREKMEDLGDTDIMTPEVGETILELKEHFLKLVDPETKRPVIHVMTTSDSKEGRQFLQSKPLKDILGVNFFPLDTWADDVERTDFYSDGIGDIVRTPNKIANTWFSQLAENRTLRNYGMHYYDSTNEEFKPQSFTPVPWGWYPLKGDPNKILKKVDIPELSESLDEMNFIIGLVERATATTATEKGTTPDKKNITLGEIELMSSKASERITSMSKFYKPSTKSFAEKWVKILIANADKLDAVELYKKSHAGRYYSKVVEPSKMKSAKGYKILATSSAEQDAKNLETIQKLQAIYGQMPNNKPLQKLYKKKMLGMIDVTPEEEKEILDFDEQTVEITEGMGAPAGAPVPAIAPPMAQ